MIERLVKYINIEDIKDDIPALKRADAWYNKAIEYFGTGEVHTAIAMIEEMRKEAKNVANPYIKKEMIQVYHVYRDIYDILYRIN